MRFKYEDAFGKSSANGYERLLLDAMLGDATFFSHRDGVEATWALFTPILDAWAKNPDTSFPNYSAGSWGPGNVGIPFSACDSPKIEASQNNTYREAPPQLPTPRPEVHH